MKRSFQFAMVLAGAVAFSNVTAAGEVKSIASFGEDGGEKFYQVMCSDNTVGSVVVHDQPNQTCAHPAWTQEMCLPTWSVQEAAAYACQ